MTDAGFTLSGEALRQKPMRNSSDTRLTEQVSIEADRLSGVVQDGVKAAEAVSKGYGNLLADTYARVIHTSMKTNSDMGNHLLTLLRAKTPADVVRTNLEFIQNQVFSSQWQLFEMMGMRRCVQDKGLADDRLT